MYYISVSVFDRKNKKKFEFEFVNGGYVLSAKVLIMGPKAETYTFNQAKKSMQMHEIRY